MQNNYKITQQNYVETEKRQNKNKNTTKTQKNYK